jgi:hypothetical protein
VLLDGAGPSDEIRKLSFLEALFHSWKPGELRLQVVVLNTKDGRPVCDVRVPSKGSALT